MTASRLAALALFLCACTAGAKQTQTAATKTAAPPTSIEQLGWLAGTWRADGDRFAQEEHWTVAGGGLMLGLHRDLGREGQVAFEYLRIEQREEGLVYLASPSGRPPTPFALVEAGESRAVFENPEHDFPKRIIYARTGDTLTARVEGDDGQGMDFVWKRSSFLPPEAR